MHTQFQEGELKKPFLRKIPGGTLLTTPTGKEIQVGFGKVHVGAGYDKKNKSAGIDVTVGRPGKGVSVGYSGKTGMAGVEYAFGKKQGGFAVPVRPKKK